MKAIINGRILLPDAEIQGKALLFNETIAGIVTEEEARARADEIIDAEGMYVSPGFIDTHIHGYQQDDASDDDPEGIRRMARAMVKNGVTSFLPTTLTVGWDTLSSVCRQARTLKEESLSADYPGAEILGIHLEGPFVNPAKKGAQNENYILAMDAEKVLPFADVIRVLTCAPEMAGGEEFVKTLREKTDIRLSLGHTTANFDQAKAAFDWGITRLTHTFNAMPPLHHRDPGTVGAALTDDRVYCELIPDTFHVHKGLFALLAKMKGDHLVLITDALRAAGLEDGEYENGGQIFVLRGIECRLTDGTIAGSVLPFCQGVRNLKENAGLSMVQAVRAGSLNAACSAGVEDRKGSLEKGKDADILLMDEECRILRTFVRGQCKYQA